MQTLVNDAETKSEVKETLPTENVQNVASVDDVMQYFQGHAVEPMQVDNNLASNDPPKKKRGRPAGSTKKENNFNQAASNVLSNSSIISGALFITMVDIILPMVIAFFNNKTSKKKIDASELQLNEKQKKDLEPICDEVVKKISFVNEPITLLIISLLGIYGFNLMAIRKIK